MKYHLNLFTPETWEAFRELGATVSGFRERHWRLAEERVSQGDIFLCYLTHLSRWCGVLEVESGPYYDASPRYSSPDPYPVRFQVKPIALLDLESAVPIREQRVWSTLTITRQHEMGHSRWTGFFRASLNTFENADGDFLVRLIKEQVANPRKYPLTNKQRRELERSKSGRTREREVEVKVLDHKEQDISTESETTEHSEGSEIRESIRYQAKVAKIGAVMGFDIWLPRGDAVMGFDIWLPRGDKARVLEHVRPRLHDKFLEELPLNYNDDTLRTIMHIDVLWLKDRAMVRAFEIEHTTAIYSGLLRMADLLALQRNINIRLHIVAPLDKQDRVLREIGRPVFSLLRLNEQCSFLSYDSIDLLVQNPNLPDMRDSIIDRHEKTAKV